MVSYLSDKCPCRYGLGHYECAFYKSRIREVSNDWTKAILQTDGADGSDGEPRCIGSAPIARRATPSRGMSQVLSAGSSLQSPLDPGVMT